MQEDPTSYESTFYKRNGAWEVLEKGEAGGRPYSIIEGVASSERRDRDGEIVRQDGIDWQPFLDEGTITFEHPRSFFRDIGEPDGKDCLRKGKLDDGTPATWLRARIWTADKGGAQSLGAKVVEQADYMAKSGSSRRPGFSVEGSVPLHIGRDPNDRKVIVKSRVTSVAATSKPRNHDSTWSILKGVVLGQHPGITDEHAEAIAQALIAALDDTGAAIAKGGTPADRRLALAAPLSTLDILAARLSARRPEFTFREARASVASLLTDRS